MLFIIWENCLEKYEHSVIKSIINSDSLLICKNGSVILIYFRHSVSSLPVGVRNYSEEKCSISNQMKNTSIYFGTTWRIKENDLIRIW